MGSCTSSNSIKASQSQAKVVQNSPTPSDSKKMSVVIPDGSKTGENSLSRNPSMAEAKKREGPDRNCVKKYKFLEVGAQDDVIFENINKLNEEPTRESMNFLVKSLKMHSFFSNLTSENMYTYLKQGQAYIEDVPCNHKARRVRIQAK